MLLNLEAPVPQQTKRKFVNLSVIKNFIRFKIFKNICNIKIQDFLLCQYAIYGPRKKSIIDNENHTICNITNYCEISFEFNAIDDATSKTCRN
jgi:hypothetical protein